MSWPTMKIETTKSAAFSGKIGGKDIVSMEIDGRPVRKNARGKFVFTEQQKRIINGRVLGYFLDVADVVDCDTGAVIAGNVGHLKISSRK